MKTKGKNRVGGRARKTGGEELSGMEAKTGKQEIKKTAQKRREND